VSDPVFSKRNAERFTPPGSPRTYTVAPLTFRERQAYRAELARDGGLYPPRPQMIEAMRAAVTEAAPNNADDVLTEIDAAEANPEDKAAQVRLAAIEAVCAAVPAYSALLAARQRYLGMVPWVAARHALRGWEGPSLPPFRRERGTVPEALLETLPDDEIEAIGWRAAALMQPGPDAAGNSGAPSPSPETPEPSTAASDPTTVATG
jgi:hypothetical protein